MSQHEELKIEFPHHPLLDMLIYLGIGLVVYLSQLAWTHFPDELVARLILEPILEFELPRNRP